jgi:tetratricopeptide (TPR) repeat protein
MGAGFVAGTAAEPSIESDLTELAAEKAKSRPSWQATLLPAIIILASFGIFFLLIYNKERPKPAGVMGQEQSATPGNESAMQGGGMEEVFARIDKMKAALQANPKDTTALFGLGQMYEMAAKFPEAEDYYRRYLEVSPGNAEVRMALAGVYFNQQKLDNAEAEMQEAVRRRPNYDFAHYNLGVIYAAAQKKAEAIKAWHKVMELSPGSELAQKSANNIQAMSQ